MSFVRQLLDKARGWEYTIFIERDRQDADRRHEMTSQQVEELAGKIWETLYNQMKAAQPNRPTDEIKAEAKARAIEYIKLLPELSKAI